MYPARNKATSHQFGSSWNGCTVYFGNLGAVRLSARRLKPLPNYIVREKERKREPMPGGNARGKHQWVSFLNLNYPIDQGLPILRKQDSNYLQSFRTGWNDGYGVRCRINHPSCIATNNTDVRRVRFLRTSNYKTNEKGY